MLRVKGSGEVLRAVCGAGGVLGRLGEDFALPDAPIACDRERCSCVADILITKRQPTVGGAQPARPGRPGWLGIWERLGGRGVAEAAGTRRSVISAFSARFAAELGD